MADPNPLFDDLGIDRNPASAGASDNPLMSDLGIEKGPQSTEDTTQAKPDSDEWNKMGLLDKNIAIAKAAPRQLFEGAGQLADTGADLIQNAFSEGESTETGQPFFEKIAHVIADRMGLPKTPESKAGRIVGAGVKALPSAAIAGPEAIVPSLAPTAASGMASQTAAEAGAGPIGQTAAGLLPFAPSLLAAGARGLVRGGAAGGEAMRNTLSDADAAGLKVSVGQASGNPIIKGVESISSRLPGGEPLAETRNVNSQVEHRVSDIQKTIDPNYDEHPHTPREAGTEIEEGVNKSIEKGKAQTKSALDDMNEAVGGENTPMAGPKTSAAIKAATQPTGIPEVDNAVTGAKTKAAAKVINSVSDKPTISTSYSTDGEGYHTVASPNGETHITEQASGNLKVVRDDTHPDFQGKGEGTARLSTAAHVATSKGVALESDASVSPGEAKSFEGLSRKGWKVEKNPNAEINPDTGNTISDSPKNPIYTVRAPSTTTQPGRVPTTGSVERKFSGEWTYDPKTGKSEPVTSSKNNVIDLGEAQDKKLFDSMHRYDAENHLNDAKTALERYQKTEQSPSFHDSLIEAAIDRFKNAKTPLDQVNAAAGLKYRAETAASDAERWASSPNVGQTTANLDPETPWTFKSFRAMRTQVGKALKTATGTQQAQLASLYGSMSEDLRDFARSKGPDAEQKYEMFNSIARTNGDQQKILNKAIKNEGGPGEIFRKAMSGSQDDAGKISRVMGAMDEDGKNTFRSVVLHRMGRIAGAQTGPFSADVFLKNWDKMSQEAKTTLFGGSNTTSQLRTGLDALTKSLTDMKAGGMLKSGLGTEIKRAGTGLSHGVGLLATLAALREFGSPVAHLVTGHPFMAAGTAASMGTALLTNPVLSRVLANPKTVSWLAQATRAPTGMAPALMAQLNRMGDKDPDAKDLASLIQESGSKEQTAQNSPQPQGGGLSEDRPITNSHKMIPMKSPSGSTYYGVDPSTL